MAGKFTNLRYDEAAYADKLARSTNPMLYKLNQNYASNCQPCFSQNGQGYGQRTDIESALKGINRINSKSNTNQILPPSSANGQYVCPDNLDPEYTRYTNPSYDIKGLTVEDMRFGYPLHDPQCQIFENFAINTRLQAKDDHKTIWQMPMDQRAVLPSERKNRVKNCKITVDCGYAPYP